MSDEPHAMIWFDAVAVIHGGDDEAARHWQRIVDVLRALGGTDVILRESERAAPDPIGCRECRIEAYRSAPPSAPGRQE